MFKSSEAKVHCSLEKGDDDAFVSLSNPEVIIINIIMHIAAISWV